MKAFRIVALLCMFALEVHASSFDPSKTVLEVHELKLLRAVFGTAACLDVECRFLLTNAHVAMVASPRAIHGDPVVQRLLATGPQDDGAVMQTGGAVEAIYNPLHDIAIYELVKPIKGFHGMPFSLAPLTNGDQVQIVAFPGRTTGIANFYRKLITWHATYLATNVDKCLLFRYEVSDTNRQIRPGSSGGIVVRDGAIVGILRGIVPSDLIAEAVPISSLEEYLAKANPYLHAQLFPHVAVAEPASLDAFAPWTTPPSTPGVLERRAAEPDDVQRVRAKAEQLYDSMKYLVAREFVSWSENDRTPRMEVAYGLRVSDGIEVYTDGKREYTRGMPFPNINGWVGPGELWLNAPRYANDLSLRVRHAGPVTVNGNPIDVYQWQAPGAESKFCQFEDVPQFPFFRHDTVSDVGCHGEIWISPQGDIVRISEAYDRPIGKWSHYESIVVYGRVMLNGESHSVPTTITTRVQYGGSKTFRCDSIFSDYGLWGSRMRLVPSSETTQ